MSNKEIRGRYGLGFSRFLFALAVIMVLLLQLMSFFVALNGGYTAQHAFVFMMVPMVGPLFCSFQLMLADAGAPMILIMLFVPCSLSILGWARICDNCKNVLSPGFDFKSNQYDSNISLKMLSEQTLPKNSIKPTPKPQPLPVTGPSPKPQPLPVTSPPPKPQPLKIKPVNHSKENDKTEIKTVKQTEKFETKVHVKNNIDLPKTGDTEYDNALRDVLSILNKQ